MVQASVSLVASTATVGVDFLWPVIDGAPAARTVTVPHGAESATMVVVIVNDDLYEVGPA